MVWDFACDVQELPSNEQLQGAITLCLESQWTDDFFSRYDLGDCAKHEKCRSWDKYWYLNGPSLATCWSSRLTPNLRLSYRSNKREHRMHEASLQLEHPTPKLDWALSLWTLNWSVRRESDMWSFHARQLMPHNGISWLVPCITLALISITLLTREARKSMSTNVLQFIVQTHQLTTGSSSPLSSLRKLL